MAVTALISDLVCTSAASAGVVGERQVNQQGRIVNGAANGELTGLETRALEHQQAHIQDAKWKAWSDGKLSHKERSRLARMQNRASTDISSLKHNGVTK